MEDGTTAILLLTGGTHGLRRRRWRATSEVALTQQTAAVGGSLRAQRRRTYGRGRADSRESLRIVVLTVSCRPPAP